MSNVLLTASEEPLPCRPENAERREFPRTAFKAEALVIDPNSAEVVVACTTELSRFGCFVETTKPLPRKSRIHVELTDDADIFRASGVVAHVTGTGMGIAFGMVESKSYEILAKWLSRTPRRSARSEAVGEVRDLGSHHEQVAITRDLSWKALRLPWAWLFPHLRRILHFFESGDGPSH